MSNSYWNEESFNFNPPKNWEEIVHEANRIIGDVIQDTECCEAAERCSQKLWEQFCETDRVGNVIAKW